MAGKNDPKVQNAVAPQQVSDLATPHTDGEPSYREQFRQAAAEAIKAATPAHQHDKSAIAENHERLQNAGMENAATSVNPTVVSRTTSTATTSSKRTEQAFEDQRSSDQILTTKSRRGRKERRFIPDSIQSLVDVLENSLSESQIQEVLEQAIEDRAQGSALQISQSELKEATEAIFEQVRLALANGDLAQVDTRRIEETLFELLDAHKVELSGEELHWKTEFLREQERDSREAQLAEAIKKKPYFEQFRYVSEQLQRELQVDPTLLSDPNLITRRIRGAIPQHTNWLALMAGEGQESFLEQLATVLEQTVPNIVTTEEAQRAARAIFLAAAERELMPLTQKVAQEELLAEYREQPCSARQDLLTQGAALTREFPELESFFIAETDRFKEVIRKDVVNEVLPIIEITEGLARATTYGWENQAEVLQLLLRLDGETAPIVAEMFQQQTGRDFGVSMTQVFGDPGMAYQILTGVVTRDEQVLAAMQARIVGIGLEHLGTLRQYGVHPTTGSREWSPEVREQGFQVVDDYVALLSRENGDVLRAYERIFGDAGAAPLAFLHDRKTRIAAAELHGLRTNDEAMKYAIELYQIHREDLGDSQREILLEYARRFEQVPPELRARTLELMDKELRTNVIQSLLQVPRMQEEGVSAYFQAVIDNDRIAKHAATIRLSENDYYHSFVDVLAVYQQARAEGTASQVGERYKALFGRELRLDQLQLTQFNIGSTEDRDNIPAEVTRARNALYQNVMRQEELNQSALRTVLAHEAKTLAGEAAEDAAGSGSWRDIYARERKELEEAARTLDNGQGITTLLIDVAYSEAFFAERHEHISRNVWRMARNNRMSQGVDGISAAQQQRNLEEVEQYLKVSMGIQEGALYDSLIAHYQSSAEHYNELWARMHEKARDLYNSFGDSFWNYNKFCRVITNGAAWNESKFEELTGNRWQQRSWGLNKTEIKALEACFRDVTNGTSLESRLRSQFYENWENRSLYAVSYRYAPEDPQHEKPLDLSAHFTRADTDTLLSNIESANQITMDAIALRQALQSQDPLPAILEILQKENAREILAEHEKLYGRSFADELRTDLITSDEVVLPGDPRSGVERRVFNEATILKELAARIQNPKEGEESPFSPQIIESIHYYSIQRLTRYAATEARLQAGTVREHGMTSAATIEYDPEALKKAVARRAEFEKFLDSFFAKEVREKETAQFRLAHEQEMMRALMFNAQQLERLAALGEHLQDSQLRTAHRLASSTYPPVEALALLAPENQSRLIDWRNSNRPGIAAQARTDFRAAQQGVYDLHAAMKEGWNAWFGTDESKICTTLRNLTDEQRFLAIDLYAMRYHVSLRHHLRGEVEGDDAARAFAEMRGDHLYADQLAILQSVQQWFGEDAGVQSASRRITQQLEEEARRLLAEEAATSEKRADQEEAAGNAEEARRLRMSAHNLREASQAEVHRSVALQSRIEELQGKFWTSFDSNLGDGELTRETLLTQELDTPDATEAIFLEGSSPDQAWRLQFQQAIQDDPVEAARLIRRERDRFLEEVLNLEVTFSDDGKLNGTLNEKGELVVDGEVISGDLLRQFYVSQLENQSLALEQRRRVLLEHNGDPAQVAELSTAISNISEMIEGFQGENSSFTSFAKTVFGVDVEESGEGEAARHILELLTINPESGAVNAQMIEQFERFVERGVLAQRCRLAIAEGSIFTDERHSTVAAAWKERVAELDAVMAGAHGEGVTVESYLRTNLRGQQRDWLLAELEGNLIVAAAHQVRRDIQGDGDDKLAVEALLPIGLVRLGDELETELRSLEESLPEDLVSALHARRDATSQRIVLESLLRNAKGEQVARIESQIAEQKVKEEAAIQIPEGYEALTSRYFDTLRQREEIRLAVRARGEAVETAYNERFANTRTNYRTGEKIITHGMWEHLESDLGRTDAQTYRQAVYFGVLTDAMRVRIAIGGLGTDEDMLFRALGDPASGATQRTLAEMTTLAEEFARIEGKTGLVGTDAVDYMRERVLSDVSGDESWKVGVLFVGRPEDRADMTAQERAEALSQMQQIIAIHDEHARGALGSAITDWFSDEGERFDELKEQFASLASKAQEDGTVDAEELQQLHALFGNADITAEAAVRQRNMVGEMIVEGVSTTVVVIGSTIVIVGSGGAGAVLIFGAAAMASRVGLSYVMKGGSYSTSQAAIDTGLVAIDVASLGTGQLISQGVRKASGFVVGRVALRRASREAAEQASAVAVRETGEAIITEGAEQTLRAVGSEAAEVSTRETVEAVAREGAEVAVREGAEGAATTTTRRWMAGQGWRGGQELIESRWWSRGLQNGIEGGLEGAFDGFLIGAWQQGFDERTWENGVLAGIVRLGESGYQHAVMGGMVGGVMAPGFDIMMRGGAGAISMIPGGRPPNGGPRGGIRGWADSFGESFVDRAAAGEVGDQTRFVSELGLDASSQRLRTASEVQTRARQRLKEAENAGEVLTGRERAQLEREANAVQRTTQALEGANVSAEIRRRPSQDGRGGEVTLAYREVQTDLNIARAERRAQFFQAFRELVRLDNGVLGRFREAGARVVGALRDTVNIWRLAADGRAYRREIGIQGAVTDRMARSVDPGNPELRTHTEASVRAASNTWDALRHGNVVRAFQEFRNWQRGTRARVGLSQQLEVDFQLTARRDQITAARDAAGAESFNPALVQYLDNVADRATRRLREGLEIVSRRREAWSNFFSLQGFPPVLQIFNGSRVRRALRDSSNAERHLVDALSSNDRLARSLHETASVPNAAPAVVEAHVARLEARAAAREGRAAVGNFVGDTLRLRPVSAVRDLFEAGRSVFSYLGPRRDLRRLLPVVDEARFTTRAVRAVETPDMAVQARRYGITRARLQNSLRAFTDPLGTARDFLQNGYARAGNLLGFDAGTPRPVRNPFGVLTDGVRAYRQSRGLQRAEREAVLARVERTSTDTARERIFGRLGRDERFSGIAVDLAEANLSRRVAFQRFRNSLRDVRDRLLAGGNGDTRSIGEVFSAVRESFGTFQSTRRDRARAFDRYLVARRQISYEGRGMGSPEALRRARQEILARRRVTRFDASDANVLIRERFGDVANSVSTTARSVSSSVRTVSEEVADRLQRLNPLQLARDGVHTLHSVTERVRTRLGQQIDGLTGSISDILSSRRRLGVLYAFERAQQLVERIGIRLPGREGRDRMVQGIRDTLRESRERLRDLAEERGLARAQQYIGTALDVGDQIVDATGRGFQRNLSAVERFAEADVVLSLTSGWNPLQWVSRFRASRNLGSARRELFEYRSFVEREAFVTTRTQELLSTLGRRELAPGLRRDKSVLELAEQLARAEGLARQQNQLFDHELFGRLNMFELPRWSRMGRYSREAGEAAQLQRELEDRFYSEIRIEQEAARLHRAAGGRDDALQASVALADAREGVRFRRGIKLDEHVRAGGDPSTFNRAQYDEALARAQFDYSLAFLRSGKDHYQALVREAESLAENVGDYVERITSRNTPWGKWLEQRSITRRLRNLSRVADSDVRLSVDIENNPYVLRSAEGPTTVLDRTTVDPVRYITEVRDSVRRQREQYRTQLEEFQTRGTEVMDALSDTRVGREGNGLELRIVRDEPEVPTRRRAEAEESDELAPIIDFYDSGPRFSPSDPKPRRTLRDRGDGDGLRQPTPPQTSLASTGPRATPVGAPESPLAMRPLPEAGDVPTPDALRQLRDDSVGFIGLSEDGAALRRELSPDELPGGSTLRLVRDEPLINFYDFKPRPVEAALRPTRTTPEADSIAPVAPPETAIPVAPREGAVARVPDAEIPVRPIPEPSSIGTPDSPLRLRDDVVDLHLADAVPNRTPKPDEEIEIVDFKPSETSPTALSETDGLVNRLKKKAAVWVMTFASMFPQPSTAMSDVASLLDSAPVASWLDINMNSGMMRNRLELQDAAPQTVRSAEVVTPGRHVEVDVDVHREIEVDVDVHRVAEVDTQRVMEWDATTHRASEMLVRHEVQISNRAAVAPCYIENHSVARAVQESTYRAVEVEESAAKARESDSPRNPRRSRRPRFRPGGDYFGEGGEFDEYVFSDPKKDGRRFGVYATDFSSYQGKGVMDLQLRKRQVDKVKEYIGMTELEFEKVKYSEALY